MVTQAKSSHMPRTHKTLPRLFVDLPLTRGEQPLLNQDQTNYLVNVLRRRTGDQLVVFNGRNGAWLAEISEAGKKSASLRLIEQSAPQTAASDLWYGFAPLKTARLDYMIQKATEMGVGTIQPVMTQHTQNNRIKVEKLRANAIEAAEQCEVLNVPNVEPEMKFQTLIRTWVEKQGDRVLVVADEEKASGSPLPALEKLAGRRVGVLVGPEGGFSSEERSLLSRCEFVVPISLGPRILRADTAAVAALAVIQSIIGDWR